ncbi:acyltransferase [Shewanella algae]|uniref:acyltransferase n=1 Tax=Shewanella algae TaxID=38313 RepID=UPI001AAFE771|nr:hypothetical protein [Shewanella algae]MBO2581705.1 hypothetical protein [Shewanella algae]
MKKIIVRVFLIVSKIVIPFFYSSDYLKGRWFEKDKIDGWVWCWRSIWFQKILGFNRHVRFPCTPNITIGNYKNLKFDNDNLDNMFSPGCYFQNYRANIIIGHGTYIAPNVGIITANHDFLNLDEHSEAKDVILGERCWLGMGAIIMPGVSLAEGTIVGAGSIVTKSVTIKNSIIMGNPAKVVRQY